MGLDAQSGAEQKGWGIMLNKIKIHLRVFPVLVYDCRAGEEKNITVPVTKEQLQAAQVVGQSSKELIRRICNRQGYAVTDIGKPEKVAVELDLMKLIGRGAVDE